MPLSFIIANKMNNYLMLKWLQGCKENEILTG
jgi:hypothetical protein